MSEPQPVARRTLLTAVLDASPAIDRVEVAQVELTPLQQAGVHRHPCPVIGYVVAGTIRFRIEVEPEKLLGSGDAFLERANARVLHFDNVSDHEPATFVACYLLSKGEDRLIEMLD